MNARSYLTTVALLVLAAPAVLAGTTYSHQEYFEHYEGTATCLECHQDAAESFFGSQHYQWRGATPELANSTGEPQGKMTMLNDFCTNPVPSWMVEEHHGEGRAKASGCSKCHAGKGKKPSPEMSQEQLENIDCLICHASGYNRRAVQNEDGSWEWKPILWKNQEGLDSVAKRISRPTRTMCLRCHSSSGGGPNFKRGDIAYELRDCEPEHDVHMASEGADLQCVDCHAGADHRVVGRGVDLVASDTPDVRLSCDNGTCHDAEPHGQELLNRHSERVNCTVCHIPSFAKSDPTDMRRDWSAAAWDEDKGKHMPAIDLEGDVTPAYAWFDGNTWAQLAGTAVTTEADGTIVMVRPQGSRDNPAARIHAFKVHRGRLPVEAERRWLLPVATEELYVHGDPDRAVRDAAERLYGIEDAQFEWHDTVRFMGIFHEVQPADRALRCLDCHADGGRLDWQALGYEADPLAACLEPAH